jgi:regulator of replication initiation timing
MFQLGKWAVLSLAICMLAAPQAKAGVGFQPALPEELKMTSEPLAPGAPAIILYRQVDRDDNIHTPHEDNYFRIKILTEEGRKHADVEIPFFKESQNVVNVRARTIRPDGSIVNSDVKVFEKYLVKGKFEGREVKYLAKTFTLPDVQVGGIIEYMYTLDSNEYTLFDSHWILNDELFTKKAQFSLKPFLGTGYVTYSLRWTWQGLPSGAAPKEGPDHIIRMEADNIPAFQTEDYMPPENELKARVDFIYEEGFPEKDQTSFWRNFGKKRNGQLESFIGKRKAMEQAVAQIVSPNDSQDVKLRKLYDRVQQIRNKSYEVQKTEQEAKREKEKPVENVEEIWKRGYGNGVQLTWLFLGLARAAGFEAYGCWVSGRGEYFFTPTMMQSAKLDSNVVLVKLNGKDVYFDPGGAFTPYGLLTWSETGVAGLRLDKDGGTWIRTTLPEPSESRIERVGKMKLSDTGDLEGKVTVTYTGLEAMYRRLEERHADQVARKKFMEERLTSEIEPASEVELTNQPDWASSETPLVAEFNVKIPGWASNAGRRVMVPAAIFTAAEKGTFEHAHRVHPIYFHYPHEKADDITVDLPPGWQVSSVPPAQDQDGHVIRYTLKVDPHQGSLRLTRKLTIDILMIEQKYYASLRNFFQVVRTGDGEQIVVQPGEIHASN